MGVSLPLLIVGSLIELSPSLVYAVTGRRAGLWAQCVALVAHAALGLVFYLAFGTWLD